jgi:hypothetical protein
LAYSLKRNKNYNKGKSGRKDFGLMTGSKKGCIFFSKGNCEKMYRKEAMKKKEERKGLIVKLKCQ